MNALIGVDEAQARLDALMVEIHGLGRGGEAVATMLSAQGIKAQGDTTYDDPIAVLVNTHIPGWSAAVGNITIMIRPWRLPCHNPFGVSRAIPLNAQEFLARFDKGEFPLLEHQPEDERDS